jgi:hypothetical protein
MGRTDVSGLIGPVRLPAVPLQFGGGFLELALPFFVLAIISLTL